MIYPHHLRLIRRSISRTNTRQLTPFCAQVLLVGQIVPIGSRTVLRVLVMRQLCTSDMVASIAMRPKVFKLESAVSRVSISRIIGGTDCCGSSRLHLARN